MPRLFEIEGRVVTDVRLRRVQRRRVARRRQRPVQVRERLHGGLQRLAFGAHGRRQHQQDALDFAAFGHFQRPDFITGLDRRQRFHEDRGAAGRDVVHHAGKVALAFAPHRHGQPPAALGDQSFAQHLIGNLLHQPFQQPR